MDVDADPDRDRSTAFADAQPGPRAQLAAIVEVFARGYTFATQALELGGELFRSACFYFKFGF